MIDKPKVWLNNKIIDWKDAQVPILSHGLSRGSGIFEAFGTHVVGGDVATFRMDAHMKRMEQTLRLLEMEIAFSSAEIKQGVARMCEINRITRSLIKVIGYWGEEAVINLVLRSPLDIAIFTIPESPELGLDNDTPITACLSKWHKPDPGAVPVMAKACANYLPGYLVRKDANDRGFDLGLTLTADGKVAEGSIESVFIVKGGVLKTPPLGNILASITRDSILTAARTDGFAVEESPLEKADLFTADEMFSCHSGIKVTPISKFEERELPAPGPVTKKVSEMMKKIMAGEDDRFTDWFEKLYSL